MSLLRAGPRLLPVLLLAGCLAIPYSDPMREARIRIARGDLMEAMLVLESIGPDHQRHAEAQYLAANIEARIRLALSHVHDGLEMRAAGDGLGAMASFSVALAVWPQCPEAACLLESTRSRRGITVHARPVAGRSADMPDTVQPLRDASRLCGAEPADEPAEEPVARRTERSELVDGPASGLTTSEHALPDAARIVPSPEPGASLPPQLAESPVAESRLPESRPTVGDADRLRVPIRVAPVVEPPAPVEDAAGPVLLPAVRDRRVKGLAQRALVRYGRGDLHGAITDWEEILKLSPGDPTAKRYLQLANRELQRSPKN